MLSIAPFFHNTGLKKLMEAARSNSFDIYLIFTQLFARTKDIVGVAAFVLNRCPKC